MEKQELEQIGYKELIDSNIFEKSIGTLGTVIILNNNNGELILSSFDYENVPFATVENIESLTELTQVIKKYAK